MTERKPGYPAPDWVRANEAVLSGALKGYIQGFTLNREGQLIGDVKVVVYGPVGLAEEVYPADEFLRRWRPKVVPATAYDHLLGDE